MTRKSKKQGGTFYNLGGTFLGLGGTFYGLGGTFSGLGGTFLSEKKLHMRSQGYSREFFAQKKRSQGSVLFAIFWC